MLDNAGENKLAQLRLQSSSSSVGWRQGMQPMSSGRIMPEWVGRSVSASDWTPYPLFSTTGLLDSRSPVVLCSEWIRRSQSAAPRAGPSCWFCIQNLRLSSGMAFRCDCQMTGRGLNLDSKTWTLPPDQRVVRLYLLLNPRIIWMEFEFVLGLLKTPKLRTVIVN